MAPYRKLEELPMKGPCTLLEYKQRRLHTLMQLATVVLEGSFIAFFKSAAVYCFNFTQLV